MQSATRVPVWLDVADFDSYEVSDTGLVRNKSTGTVLKPQIQNDGREQVNLCRGGKAKTMKVHRLVCATFRENPENKPCVDHIDNNVLNNCAVNLRWATHAENNRNRTKRKNTKSGYKGVVWHKRRGKWRAQIGNSGKTHYLGFFTKPEEAATAYDKAAIEMFGEFAKLNFPAPVPIVPQAKIKLKFVLKIPAQEIEIEAETD